MAERRAVLLVLAGLALAGLGCGGTDSSGGSSERAKVTVLETAGVPAAFVSYGVHTGAFRRHGIDLRVKVGQGGAATIPAVVSGDVEFGGSNVVSVLLAAGKGLPIKLVAPGTFATDDAQRDFSSVLVKGDSPIRAPRDLEGKTIAVNTLDNINVVTTKAALEKEGVDVSKLEFTEVDFPDMAAALDTGRVDAVAIIEPFQTIALDSGARAIVYEYAATSPGLQIGAYVTSAEYLNGNRDVVERFAAAIADTARAVSRDPRAFRDFLPQASLVKPALARKIVLPHWKERSDPASLELVADLMVKHGVADEKPNVSELLGQ